MSAETPHTQEVVTTVTDGDKTATFRSTREHNWPGSKPQHITHLIDSTAGMAKSAILETEKPSVQQPVHR